MSRFILARAVTIPAGTPVATPAQADISFPQYEVDLIQWVIPPGPNGLVGFRLANAGVQVIPYGSNNWIIGNNEVSSWPLTGQITSGSWQVFGYNTGNYDHTIQFRFAVSAIGAPAPEFAATPLDLSGLGGGAAGPSETVRAEIPTPPPGSVLTNPPPSQTLTAPPPLLPPGGFHA